MAQDYVVAAAQNYARRRTGQSFFPAANYYRGININARPNPNAVTSFPQGQTIIPSRYGTSSAVLPPDQNPAYQAAIANNPTPASRYAAAKSEPFTRSNIGTYQSDYGPRTVVKTGSNSFRTYDPQGGYEGRTGNAAEYLARQQGVSYTPPAPISYGSQVGFSMLSNVPSPPSVSVPPTVARPYETPPAPFTTAEKFGQTLALANPLRAIPPITNALTSFGRGVFGFGRDIYGGLTGNRSTQPQPSEMGSGATPVTNPITPNLWGNSFWNRGLPPRFSDAQPNDYFPQQ